MRIAVSYENGAVFQHFGHTEQFKVYDAEDGKHISFKSMMPYFMLIEVWYVKYRMYVHRLKEKTIQSTI